MYGVVKPKPDILNQSSFIDPFYCRIAVKAFVCVCGGGRGLLVIELLADIFKKHHGGLDKWYELLTAPTE